MFKKFISVTVTYFRLQNFQNLKVINITTFFNKIHFKIDKNYKLLIKNYLKF